MSDEFVNLKGRIREALLDNDLITEIAERITNIAS
jgi:hypothetical protein